MQPVRAESEFAAFAALDWGNQKHVWKFQVNGSEAVEKGELESKPELIDAWAIGLRERFAGGLVAVGLEQSRGGLVYGLSKYAHLVLFLVHPKTSANFRQALYPSGAKSDPSDAALLLELLQKHRHHLRCLRPDTEPMRAIQLLAEQRRKLVKEKTRNSQQLGDCLKGYFPQVVEWFADVDSPLVCDLLQKWGSLAELQRAHPGTLTKFFRQHHCRAAGIRDRIQAIYQAKPVTSDAAILEHGSTNAGDHVAILEVLHKRIGQLDRRLKQLFEEQADSAIFASFPCAGPALAPRLMVAWGSDRDRYRQAEEMQRYSGTAPVEVGSGKIKRVCFRRACPKFLRQTFHEYANCSRRKSQWAQAFYQMKRDQGIEHHAAIRLLAFKWIRIMFRCWQNRTPYDEQTYVRALAQRNSPLHKALGTTVECKNVAGFKKLSPKSPKK
jgi:transposase